ncbi:MAG: serine/threonine protein kinase [Deltaproteobacteria bacterium]|nr:serine/threonine protein kinase [Deltaproteobacteria bacterium]
MADQGNVFGFYVLLRSLGSGGMGEVSLAKPLAENAGIPTPVVVKRLHSELATHQHFLQRFEHEAKIAAAISHSKVARVYDAGRVGDTLYLTMQYIEGWSIAKVLDAVTPLEKRVSIKSAAEVAIGVLEGTGSLHSAKDTEGAPLAIVHRDICPKNVMLDANRDPCLIDFGLGKSRYQDWKTRTGTVMGTPGYMAPEQVLAEQVDHRTDLYACGVILWELLALRPYIERGTLSEMLRRSALPEPQPISKVRPDASPELEAVLLRALAREAEDRFTSAEEFVEALRRAIPPTEALPSLLELISEPFQKDLDQARVENAKLLRDTQPRFGGMKSSRAAAETFAVRPDVAIQDLRTSFEEAVGVANSLSPAASDASYETLLPEVEDTRPDHPQPLIITLPTPLGRPATPTPGTTPAIGQLGPAGGSAELAVPSTRSSKTLVLVTLGAAALALTFLLGRISAKNDVSVEAVTPMPGTLEVGAKEGAKTPGLDTPPKPVEPSSAVVIDAGSAAVAPRAPPVRDGPEEPVVGSVSDGRSAAEAPAQGGGEDLGSLSNRAQSLFAKAVSYQKVADNEKKAKALDLVVRIQSELSAPNQDRLSLLSKELDSLMQ